MVWTYRILPKMMKKMLAFSENIMPTLKKLYKWSVLFTGYLSHPNMHHYRVLRTHKRDIHQEFVHFPKVVPFASKIKFPSKVHKKS